MRVGVLGGSGFIGKHLIASLQARGDTTVTASLHDPQGAAAALCATDAVVNLAGEPVAQRWTAAVKKRIEESRTISVHAFMDALATQSQQPARYISASAVGYYGTSETAEFTEESPPGTDFLARVCVGWEREARRANEIGISTCCVRTGFVLGNDGGALEKILPPFRMGAGGRVASGKQWYSWIHIDDVVGIYQLAIDGAEGTLNATAPNPVRNSEFTNALARALHRPAFLPVPSIAMNAMLGEGAYIVTQGQRVLPMRPMALGYEFCFRDIDAALKAIV